MSIGGGGYVYVWGDAGGVPEHRLLVERLLEKRLPAKARVHHVNGNKADNRPRNLVACEDDAYHKLLHRRAAAMAATGNPNARYCKFCKTWDDPAKLVISPGRRQDRVYHSECRNRARRITGIPGRGQWRKGRSLNRWTEAA